ncbi:MAG: hypothetical protein LBQ20_05085, partial [Rhodanobacter sp.]|nr:hypothetical protein [Rhodanobacter sp.]
GGITYAAAAQVQQLVIINLSTPPTPLTPQEITGAWYTPIHNGSGFNITQTDQGLILFYYGWDSSGHRLWLISDIGPRQIVPETSITLNMNQTVGGHFQTPALPSTLTKWGMLTLSFSTGGTTATATLTGKDGTVSLGLQKLAGMVSTSSFTGAWYDPAYNGSGFNILIAPQGLVLFYYGWDNDGNRLWLISDIDPAAITPGTPITLNMNQTSGGHFLTPANPSSTLSQWGTLKLDFSSCTKGTGSLTSTDGSSAVTFDNLQMIAGVMNAPGC